MIESYLIPQTVRPNLSGGIFLRLLGNTVSMLAFGYVGEFVFVDPTAGFVLGIAEGVKSCKRNSYAKLALLLSAAVVSTST